MVSKHTVINGIKHWPSPRYLTVKCIHTPYAYAQQSGMIYKTNKFRRRKRRVVKLLATILDDCRARASEFEVF